MTINRDTSRIFNEKKTIRRAPRNVKIWEVSLFIFLLFVFLSGCSKKSKAILLSPGINITKITGISTQINNSKFPENKAYVSILDQNSNPVTDFAIGNFSISEEGNPGIVTEVKKVDNSIDLLSAVLVLDRSGSMTEGTSTEDLNAAAKSFINNLSSYDQVEIIDFASTVSVSQPFTTNKSALINTIDRAIASGGTAFYDGIAQAITDLSNITGRKIIIAMTDGMDTGSSKTVNQVIDDANENGLAVFVVGLNNPAYGGIESSTLKNIAESTSGRYFESSTSTSFQLSNIFSEILKQINNQVNISFRSLISSRPRTLKFYVNYGTLTTTFEKKYSYQK